MCEDCDFYLSEGYMQYWMRSHIKFISKTSQIEREGEAILITELGHHCARTLDNCR